MDELEVQFINEKTFIVRSFRSSNAGVCIKFTDELATTFKLNKNGGLPDNLFEFISEQSGIPKDKLAIHIFEV